MLRLLAVLGVLLLVAGCFGGKDAPAQLRFGATGGKVSPGWAYDGEGLAPSNATLLGELANADNTGLVNVTFNFHHSQYAILFDEFAQAPGKDFQDGGIAFDLDEHGSSGHGDNALPMLHARGAAWGTAVVLRDGEPETVKPWTAHLMLSEDTVRSADGRISLDDASVVKGDPQAIFLIKHPDGENASIPPLAVSQSVSCAGPCNTPVDIPVQRGAEALTINVTLAPSQGPLAAGQGTLRVVDANGTDIGTPVAFQVTPADAGKVVTIEVAGGDLHGPVQLVINGQGAFVAQVDASATYDLHPFIVVTWDDITYS